MNSTLTMTVARTAKYLIPGGIVSLQTFAFFLQSADRFAEKKSGVYNILWVLVFGFATLNILGLIARRFEPRRSSLNLGEILAITVVVVAVILLSWEMLYLFHILPIRLETH